MRHWLSVGIDPGKRGAIVALTMDGDLHRSPDGAMRVFDMPAVQVGKRTELDKQELRRIFRQLYGEGAAVWVVERQSTRPGLASQSVLSTGYGWGLLVGLVYGLGGQLLMPRPQEWQRECIKGSPGEGKGRALLAAGERWPDLRLTTARGRQIDGRADAAWLAEFGRRMRWGGGA